MCLVFACCRSYTREKKTFLRNGMKFHWQKFKSLRINIEQKVCSENFQVFYCYCCIYTHSVSCNSFSIHLGNTATKLIQLSNNFAKLSKYKMVYKEFVRFNYTFTWTRILIDPMNKLNSQKNSTKLSIWLLYFFFLNCWFRVKTCPFFLYQKCDLCAGSCRISAFYKSYHVQCLIKLDA